MIEFADVPHPSSYSIVTLCDWHVPYEDPKAIRVAFEFCRQIQPQTIVIHEAHDFYALSRFDKNPERKLQLQREIDIVKGYLSRLKSICPTSRIIVLRANHTDRLQKYLWTKAEELSGLDVMQLEELLGFKRLGIEYLDYYIHKAPDPRGHFLFKHGDIVRQHSAYTAKGELEREGMSGMSGHTHRLGAHYSRKRGGFFVWVEAGCLCDLNPGYLKGTANWQHGIGVVTYKESGHFIAEPVPIIDYELVWGDLLITL